VNGVTPFIAYCLFMAVFVTLTPRVTMFVYGAAAATFITALVVAQPDSRVRLALLPNGISIVVVSIALAWIFHATRRRDFGQRATIERQRAELSALNAQLEARVSAQVSEIVARAREVEHLNARLRTQVRERSSELSIALAKLAQHREMDGTLRPGFVLGERFRIDDFLGEGGMGVVYSGVELSTDTAVAIKVIQASSSRQLDALHRFLREARAGATVVHPAIVRTLHVDVSDDGVFFQVQELIDGEPLDARSGPGWAWEPAEAARLVAVIAGALAAAHAEGVVHRDVKPSNVMLLGDAPGAKLLDFGIAKLYENADPTSDSGNETRTGAILGTPQFMSPEQLEGKRHVTGATDVYAVGVMLFMLLAEKLPFADGTLYGVVYAHLSAPAPDVRSLAPTVPAPLAELVARCLAKDPADRPTAEEVAREAQAIADEANVPALEEVVRRRKKERPRDASDVERRAFATTAVVAVHSEAAPDVDKRSKLG
jgi:serine/threonine-protein kinase